MRKVWAVILLLITIAVTYILNTNIGATPPLGRFLDPMNGCWANAEPVNKSYNISADFSYLKEPVTIWFDNRMVPHIHAQNDSDLYFVQGYLHAYFRLWQMDIQARAAAGRVSEIIGEKTLDFDRKQRRKGMVFGAEHTVQAMEADPATKAMADAYTAGVNEYISSLCYKTLPLEYKLLNYTPEKWTNLKTALLLKYMADDLTGYTEDIPLTYLRDRLSPTDFALLFPEKIAGSSPVIPAETPFGQASLPVPAVPDSIQWPHLTSADFDQKKEEGKGSNNWALSGSKTQSGAAILCNDPHLALNLPSLWFEVQLQSPGMNVYGVSLPGAPGVIIGFNDSISWGFTNNYRDVKDFYELKPVAGEKDKYWFDGQKQAYKIKVERIRVKGQKDFLDTVRYAVQGPVMYDDRYHGPGGLKVPLALCWMGHRGTNEMLSINLLNRAKTYPDFIDAIMNFQCPGQNMVYADRSGNIAMWGQGQFINKWKEQGRFVMDGSTSKTLWRQPIPMKENPHVLNPERGYVSSANQSVTDSTYPYWYNGYFLEFRAWRINSVLDKIQHAGVRDMFALQNDTYSVLAANTLPVMLRYLPTALSASEAKYADMLRKWDYRLDAHSTAATVYQCWWNRLYNDIWSDDFSDVPADLWPLTERTMQLVQTDTALSYYDDKHTPAVEHLGDMVWRAFKETMDSVSAWQKTSLEWYKVKNTCITHLAKLPAFSFDSLQIGGWGNTVDAAKHDHGPSWRMVVQLGRDIEAYGVYPGGQSGNPGSKHYADFIPDWAAGKYYSLQFLPNKERQSNNSIQYTMILQP